MDSSLCKHLVSVSKHAMICGNLRSWVIKKSGIAVDSQGHRLKFVSAWGLIAARMNSPTLEILRLRIKDLAQP